ncbi:cyclin-like protein [Amanita muscaria]
MAADFWSSSHYKRWMVDRASINQARAVDILYVDNHDPEYFDFQHLFRQWCVPIMKLGRRLSLRQRVIATAIIFFKRFYLKNSYCETDPFLVIAACCYLAAKAEECPVSIKQVALESKAHFSLPEEIHNVKSTNFDHTRIAEMEFYLVDDLESDLTIYHPYRTLTALCPRYWGTGQGQLELPDGGFQRAWFIINDTYRSNICLIYPSTSYRSKVGQPPDTILTFLASLNVSFPLVATIIQEIVSLWTLWDRYKEDATDTSSAASSASPGGSAGKIGSTATLSTLSTSTPTPTAGGGDDPACTTDQQRQQQQPFSPRRRTSVTILDPDRQPPGMGKAANKMLERAQAAG